MANEQKCCISGENLNILAVCAANILAKGLDVNELALLSTLFGFVGNALSVIAAERALCEDENQNKDKEQKPPVPFR